MSPRRCEKQQKQRLQMEIKDCREQLGVEEAEDVLGPFVLPPSASAPLALPS